MDNEYLDLSLQKNQNELAVKISNFFDKDEALTIDLSNLEKANRSVDEIQYLYYTKKFPSGKEVKIIDTLLLDRFPAIRYVTIRLSYKEQEQLDYNIKFNKNILKQLNIVFAKMCNYMYWASNGDNAIIRSHILENFSKHMQLDISSETLEEAKFVINCLISDGSIKSDNNFVYDFSISKIDFHVESNTLGIVKFGYKLTTGVIYNMINFVKTDTGISYILYVLEQAQKIGE